MSESCDVLVVGAGPAGLAAAAAAQNGMRVIVLDDNAHPGGQIWRSGASQSNHATDPAKAKALAAFQRSGATLHSSRQVVDAPHPGTLHAFVESTQALESYHYGKLILATGARERFLPFPGWTLPGVFGAGGLQALVRNGFSIRDKRVVVAGTGPLLLAVAAHLQADGAAVVSVAEQAPLNQILPFALRLVMHPDKIIQGVRFRTALRDVPYHTGCWPVRASGSNQLASVMLTNGDRTWIESCDLLACGFHLVPNTELASLLGCVVRDGCVIVDEHQATSVSGIFCAGEPTGIAGVDAALVQGTIAGLAAAGKLAEAHALHARRKRESAFGSALNRAFALRSELKSLAATDTIVCRCEDVRYSDLVKRTSWTDAKLQTRCGMGPCQGRVCGSAVEFLFGWHNNSVRPPIFPVPLSALCENPSSTGRAAQNDPIEVEKH